MLSSPEQSVSLTWKEGYVLLDRMSVIPELAVEDVKFDWRSDLQGNASVNYQDAVITISYAEKSTLSMQLSEGEIHSDDVLQTLASLGISSEKFDAEAVIHELDFSIPATDLEKQIPYWDIKGMIGIKSARWESSTAKNAKLTLSQQDETYQLRLDGIALNTPLELDIKGDWSSPELANWWESTSAKATFKTEVNDGIIALIPELKNLPDGLNVNQTKISGEIEASLTETKFEVTNSDLEISGLQAKEKSIPTLSLSSSYINDGISFNLKLKKSDRFLIDGKFSPESQKYAASFTVETTVKESPWINALAEIFHSPVALDNNLDLKWNGTGDLKANTHQGSLNATDLSISQQGQAPATVQLKGSYDFPNSIDITSFSTTHEELSAEASLLWDGKEISIRNSEIKRDGERIGSIKGKLPFSAEIDTSKKFFAQTQAWNLRIDTEKLLLERMAELFSIPEDVGLTGTFQTNLKITGSPHTPQVNGKVNADNINDHFGLGLDKISINTKLTTQDKLLNIEGKLLEQGTQRMMLDLELPFTPHQWLEDDNLLESIQKNSNLKGTAEIKQLPLGRFAKLIPELEKLNGQLDAKAEFQGTIAEPKYKINFQADLPIVSLKNAGVDDITNINIKGTLDQTMILNGEIDAKINGGKFTTLLKVDVNDTEKPVFDISLVTDHALIYRDDVLAMRANAKLNLKGTMDDAVITGDVGILESLFYKDVDLIPIGVPSASIGSVSLPSIDTKKKQTLPIPAPFDQWKLDLRLKTIDPILIRGNVGSGRIEGSIKVAGTLAKPSLDGTLYAKKVRAKLPFSVLSVDNGKIIFSPGNGFIPSLDIRGTSQVGVHNVNLFAYGLADNPKIALSSYPALPENEIMTLLATGATNSGLANRDVATFKTLQILLLELKQRSDRPDGNRLFSRILSGVEDLDLKVGEVNELTGEKYASATVELHRRWFLTAQIDNNQPPQTRGLLIFALRFE